MIAQLPAFGKALPLPKKIFSTRPLTEESITSSYVRRERPDVIVNMVDATNLSRSLFFTTQLLELGIPVVVALNKQDLNEKKGNIILVCNAAVHIMQNFNWSLQLVEEGMEHTSILATIATPFAILMIPLGFGVWQLAAAAVIGYIVKKKKSGAACIGCPDGHSCPHSKHGGCSCHK